ncbi:MAG: hypothetical protein RLZZ234_12 [Candidatus Parcubacteria bacterium]|jgi:hypothetical protein
MSNLLPPLSRRDIVREYRVRVYVVWCVVLALAALVVSLLFLPSYLSVMAELSYATTAYDKESAATRDEYASALADIREANVLGEQLGRTATLITMTDIMEEVDKELRQDIVFTGLDMSRPANNPITVQIRGVAATRDGLAGFVERLKRNPYFSDVTIPFSQLAQAVDAPFTATLSIRPRATKEAIPLAP